MEFVFWLKEGEVAGRTGLVMAYFMCKEYGLSVNQAMDYVLQLRPIAFSAENWIEYCTEILDEYNAV